jgi:flagellar hook-basal body complex protein FliE
MVNALNATNAYRSQLKMQEGIKEALDSGNGTPEASFSQMLGDSLKESVGTLRESEALKMESLTGNVELTDLVTAVTNAELTLNTVVAIRDKVIGAYQDIIRMPI